MTYQKLTTSVSALQGQGLAGLNIWVVEIAVLMSIQ